MTHEDDWLALWEQQAAEAASGARMLAYVLLGSFAVFGTGALCVLAWVAT